MADTTGTRAVQIKSIDRQGTGAKIQMFAGSAPATGHLATYDASGNVIDGGAFPTQPYDVVCSLVGQPAASATVLILTFTRAVVFAGNFAGSYGTVGANPTATATYTVKQNGTSIGTVAISTGGACTFATTSGAAQSFVAGDRMTVIAPSSADATLADVGMTFAGTR